MSGTKQSGLSVVGVFWYPHEAQLARALLESEGIPAWVLDEHQVQMRWHLAAALGGVKVAVAPSDEQRAGTLLARDHSDALAGIPEAQLPPAEEEQCPRCHGPGELLASTSQLPAPVQWLTTAFFLLVGALVPRRRVKIRYRCQACDHTWSTSHAR